MSLIKQIFFGLTIKLSYGITVCNEADELNALLTFLIKYKNRIDDIIVLYDITYRSPEVELVLRRFGKHIQVRTAKLDGDFASFKNNLLTNTSGDYLFQIDADEIPNKALVTGLKQFLHKNKDADCFLVPRVNIVKGITKEQIDLWNWKIDEQERINFPDYQFRIFKLNSKIYWRNKVHEELIGYSKLLYLSAADESMCLYHIKDIERQTKQNDFYNSLDQ